MRYFRVSRIAVFACLLGLSQLAANAQDSLTSAKELFQSGQYQKAEAEFQRAIQANPTDMVSYYWYGLCQMRLGNFGSAQTIFDSIANRERASELGRMAREGVAYCRAELRAKKQATTRAAAYKAANPSSLDSAMRRISRQGRHAAARQERNWNDVATAAQDASDRGAAALDKQASRAAKAMESWHISGDGGDIPLYSQDQINSVTKTYTDQRDGLVAAEKQAKINAQIQGRQSAASINSDVENLQQQLQGNELPSGLKLVPDGTNFYTRNYAPTTPTVPAKEPDEMKATEERMVLSPHTVPGKTITKSSVPEKDPRLEVKGVVTRP